jgi:hypothetical protein
MKPRLLGLLFLLPLLPAGLAAAGAPADTFAPVKAQIDLLLEHRRTPPPFTPAADNPFVRPGGGEGELVSTTPANPGPAAKANPTVDLIHRLAAQLRISGSVNLGGRIQVIINGTPCEEGRMLPVREGDMLYRLLIKSVTANSVVIQLGEAEMTVNIR